MGVSVNVPGFPPKVVLLRSAITIAGLGKLFAKAIRRYISTRHLSWMRCKLEDGKAVRISFDIFIDPRFNTLSYRLASDPQEVEVRLFNRVIR